MFKKIFAIVLAATITFAFAGCDLDAFLTTLDVPPNENEAIPLSFVAELYDNHGIAWMAVEGSRFDIKPNKVKQYSYSSSGEWISEYELSSVITVEIDGKDIETCGSTVLIYDTRLEKLDIEVPKYINIESDNIANITDPNDVDYGAFWTLNYWWRTKNINNKDPKSRVVIIQSQEGDPICMFRGAQVSWDIPKNLPKTTEINIDGMKLYIHRANFAVVDLTLFNSKEK